MTLYAYSPVTGELINTAVVADWMGTTDVPAPDFDPVTAGCFWRGDHWEVEQAQPPVMPVPQTVSRAQGKAALIQSGLWSQVLAYVDGIADPTQKALAEVALHDTLHWQRSSPFLAQAAQAMGFSDEDLDELFVTAAAIEL